jgi:hypothetical protein
MQGSEKMSNREDEVDNQHSLQERVLIPVGGRGEKGRGEVSGPVLILRVGCLHRPGSQRRPREWPPPRLLLWPRGQ